jgi:glycosyltransferase involved in cell wall biosynthesis
MESNSRLKIFVDAHVFDGEFQGTRTFIKGIYSILATKPDLQLFLGAHNIDTLKKEFSENGNISFIKYKNKSSLRRLLFEIPSLIKKHHIRYAHFQYISPVIKNCKFIVTIHDLLFIDYPQEFPLLYRITRSVIFRLSAVRADIVSTVSQYSKSSMHRHFKIDPQKIHITANGVSSRFFQPYDKAEAKKFISQKYGIENFILYVSRIEPRKNHILLVKAFVELKLYEQGMQLVLIGHKSIAASEFDNFLNDLPLDVRRFIYIIYEINDDDLLDFYRAARIFVYPSKAEGFGIPPLEAAALKIPVLCSNTTAMSDFSFFGKNYFDPLDYDSFKNKLAGIVHYPPDQSELSRIADLIRDRYSWNQSAEKLYQVIKKDTSPMD